MQNNIEHIGAFDIYVSNQYVIVTANKVASRYIEQLLQNYVFKKLPDVDEHVSEFMSSYSQKYMIYRYPLDRFIGWYATFIQDIHLKDKHKLLVSQRNTPLSPLFIEASKQYKCDKSLIWNCHNFIFNNSIEKLEYLLNKDSHTVSLYSYFKLTKMNVDEYTIVPLSHLNIFIYSIFGTIVKNNFLSTNCKFINFTKETLDMLNTMDERISILYKDDIEILLPRANNFHVFNTV
jgi:hypothetical protein